ncbi:RNA 3'-terminal phosphate cyclase [Kamptonema cortianum]|nr:RNA 3'-terminal phosphate cyclase [Geitlerinema splendidum]MDK3162220.1 RNA 3'-terminal phosphate cyclase [Kamptonema cortianum]
MTGEPTIVITGAYGEGGGILLRTALSMSVLTQRAIKVTSVRGALRKPGLSAEDIAFAKVLAQASGGELQGDEIGSRELEFAPKHSVKPVSSLVDIQSLQGGKTPGNCLIIAQSLFPTLARAGAYSQLDLTGETHNNGALSFDAFDRSTLAAHRHQGLYAFASLIKTGFGYGTQGQVSVQIEPSALNSINWVKRGQLVTHGATITNTGVPSSAVDQASKLCAELLLQRSIECPIEVHEVSGNEPGLSLTIWSEFEQGMGSASGCLNRGGKPKPFVEGVVGKFFDWLDSDATVDSYLADQLMLPAVLADGKSTYSAPIITRRLTTLAWVVKQFMPVHITIRGKEGEPGHISIEK